MVIWPRDRYFSILAGEGPDHAIPALEELVDQTEDPAADAGCLAFAAAIVTRWNAAGRTYRSPRSDDELSLSARMLSLLDQLGSTKLAARFVRDILPDHANGSEGPALAGLIGRQGWAEFAEPLRQFFARQAPNEHDRTLMTPVALFEALCCSDPKMSDERLRSVRPWRATWNRSSAALTIRRPRLGGRKKVSSATGIPERVFRALAAIGDNDRLDRFLAQALADAKHYDLHGVLIPAVKALPGDVAAHPCARPAWDRLREHCLGELRARTAAKPEPPADWTREANLDCRCADCRELAAFLQNPGEQVHRFPRRKDLRQHLHREIEKHHCDLTHMTIRKGSPQTLVCTKTQASHERRLAQFNVDMQLLRELESLSAPEAVPAAAPKKSRRTKRKPS